MAEATLFQNFRTKVAGTIRKLKIAEREGSRWSTVESNPSQKDSKVDGSKKKLRLKKRDTSGISQAKENFMSIQKAANHLKEIKDIRDELNILKAILTHQKKVWDELHDVPSEGDGLKGPAYNINEIEEMDMQANRVQNAVGI